MTAIWFAVASVARGDDVSRAASDLFTKYAAEIEELAAWCDQQGLAKKRAEPGRGFVIVIQISSILQCCRKRLDSRNYLPIHPRT